MANLCNTFIQELLDLVFLNQAIANLGDASGLQPSAVAGSLYFSLHTADPGVAGTGATSEATYTSYARVAVARSGAGYTRSTNTIRNTASVTFPASTGGSETLTYVGLTVASSGTSMLLARAVLSAPIVISDSVQPQFLANELAFTFS